MRPLSDESPPAEGAVEIPIAELPPETLRRVIADLVTRDGTDYGAVERTFEQKAAALLRELERGEAKLVFDLASETIGLMTRAELERARQQEAARAREEGND
jgi:uncharacterized protein YheU (UPF0270 family)